MSNRKKTDEEKTLLAINAYEDPSVERLLLQKNLGFNDKKMKQVLHLLTHGNCIRKQDDTHITITAHGKKICESLMEDSF